MNDLVTPRAETVRTLCVFCGEGIIDVPYFAGSHAAAYAERVVVEAAIAEHCRTEHGVKLERVNTA